MLDFLCNWIWKGSFIDINTSINTINIEISDSNYKSKGNI